MCAGSRRSREPPPRERAEPQRAEGRLAAALLTLLPDFVYGTTNFVENVPHWEFGTISFHAHTVEAAVSRVTCDVSPQRWTPKLASKSPVSVALLVNGTSSVGSAPA